MFQSLSVSAKPSKGGPDLIVLGQFQGQPLDAQARKVDVTGAASAASQRPEATGEVGAVVEAYPTGKGAPSRMVVVGLGDRGAFEPGVLRQVAGAVGRRIASARAAHVDIELSGAIGAAKSDPRRCGSAMGEGLGLFGWTCDQFKGRDKPREKRSHVALNSSDGAFVRGLERGVGVAKSANIARTFSETPPNIATPAWMAQQARAIAAEVGLTVSVFQGSDLERERFTGLVNVGKASENAPCMIRLEYNPGGKGKGAKNDSGLSPYVLIGKTMCYDSGGLSLKIENGMLGMKRDKDGGCAVLGAMHAIATVIRPKRPVVALLAAAENSVSERAYRPDDIITYRNGVTVEVTNTDAEGRLVLADALCWACEKERPGAIIDLATLTGGVVVALGSTYAGMFCDNTELRERIERASTESGERVWRLPLHKEYRDMMKSPVADLVNSNRARKASPIQGAAFLDAFVDPKIPWAHLDIAGVHAVEKASGPFAGEGPTGWGVLLLASLFEADAP